MKQWLIFLFVPTLLNFVLALVLQLALGQSISMTVYCVIMGALYGSIVFSCAPKPKLVIALIWLVGVYVLQYQTNIGLPDNADGSRLTQTLVEGVFAWIGMGLSFLGKRVVDQEDAKAIP